MIVDLPSEIKVSHENFWLMGGSVDSERGLDSREQVVFTENRYWEGQVSLPVLLTEGVLQTRALLAKLRGRFRRLRLTLYNHGTPRLVTTEAAFLADQGVTATEIADGFERYLDDTHYSDGTGFALPSSADPTVITARLAGSYTVALEGFIGRNLAVGAFFSVNDFLYVVEENQDGFITFSPPLREAVASGATVNVNRPTVLIRAKGPSLAQPFVELARYQQRVTFEVEEAFER